MKKLNPGFYSPFDPGYYALVTNGVPTSDGGYKLVPQAAQNYAVTMTGSAIRAACVQKTDGTAKLFAATATKIYELTSGPAWTDRSSGGGSYTSAASWNFCQFGDQTIAVSIENATQVATTGAFAALSGSPPKAKFCCTQNLAVILAHYNDGALYTDGWWASDVGDATTWTPSASNDAAFGRLLQTPGPITGLMAFRNKTYLFKENSFYVMEYVGAPFYYQVNVVDYNVGASTQSCILSLGDSILFCNKSGFYLFDGQSVRKLSDGTRASNLSSGNITETTGNYFDEVNGLAYFVGCTYNKNSDAFGALWDIYTSGGGKVLRTIVMGTQAAIRSTLPASGSLGGPSFMVANSTNSDLVTFDAPGGKYYATPNMVFDSNLHGVFDRMTTWSRLTPVMAHDAVYLTLPVFACYKRFNAGVSTENANFRLTDGSPTSVSGATYSPSSPPRWNFLVTARFAQFVFTVASSQNAAATGSTVYDYVLKEADAGTD